MFHELYRGARVRIGGLRTGALLAALGACGGGSPPQRIDASGSDGGSGTGAGTSAGGFAGSGGAASPGEASDRLPAAYQAGAVEGAPLLARLPDNLPCSVTHAPALLGTEVGVPVRAGAFIGFAYAQSSPFSSVAQSGVRLAPVLDGALGTSIFALRERMAAPELRALFDGERITLLWRSDRHLDDAGLGSEGGLALAQVDTEGAILTPPTVVVGSGSEAYGARLVATPLGFVLSWIQHAPASSHLQARVAQLDRSGSLVGEPRVLLDRDGAIAAEALTSIGERVVATFRSEEEYTSVFLDAAAQPLGDAIAIGEPHWTAILPRGERLLSAWSVRHTLEPTTRSSDGSSEPRPSRASSVRIGWFDREGKSLGAARDLQAPVPDEENVDPVWVDLGEDVGLLWSRGSAIYFCAGCTPDNHLQLVVLDGDTLEPKSGLLRLDSPASDGGLIHPQLIDTGSDLLITADVGYHVTAESMAATVRCSP